MSATPPDPLASDPVKTQVAAHWDRRAAHFDEDFGHSIGSPAERAAWDRILGLVIPAGGPHDVLDAGCAPGFWPSNSPRAVIA